MTTVDRPFAMAEVFIPPSSVPGLHTATGQKLTESQRSGLHDQMNEKTSDNGFVFPHPFPSRTPPQQNTHIHGNSPSSGPVAHRQRPNNLSLGTLPPFDFGSPTSDNAMRPQISPVRLSPPIGHVGGHRRGGSEFVGGDITHGGPVLVSSTASEDSSLHPPPSPVKGPPQGRRGHAHRRSHAVSQSDVRSIMHPAAETRPGSTPSSPSVSSMPQTASSLESGQDVQSINPYEPKHEALIGSPPGQGQLRSRVGFVDNVEFIPRPLSTISSETSSSMSTIRANHSVSDSVSSFIHGGLSNSPSPRVPGPLDSTSAGRVKPRLNRTNTDPTHEYSKDAQAGSGGEDSCNDTTTSNAISKSDLLAQTSSTDQIDVLSESGPSSASTQRTFFSSQQERSPSLQPCHQRPDNASSANHARPRTSPEFKSTSKQQRVKSWADMILHRKEKHCVEHTESADESSHKPPQGSTFDDFTFDDDTTFIIEEPPVHGVDQVARGLILAQSSSGPLSPSLDATQSSPMIDIDAAMSTSSNLEMDQGQDGLSKTAAGKRRLHSSGETGGFTGPGMHYHRRAESAPELEPFERPRFGFPRLGSNPALEEAIVEEDEDLNREAKRDASEAAGLGVNVVESVPMDEEPIRRPSARASRGPERRKVKRISTPPTPLRRVVDPAVEIVSAEEEPRFSLLAKSSNESTITPKITPDPLSPRPASAPLDSALQTPSLTYGSTPETPSAVSSADYRKTSFDTRDPRVHTARSSMTDRTTLNSSKGGDFSASSIDDVPSLTSSASTMLSGHPNRFSSSGQAPEPTPRSASVSTPKPFRTRPGSSNKRASLASLSKLMGPYNKSKLNIAESIPPDSPEKPDKKRHRISRMVRFWKSKE